MEPCSIYGLSQDLLRSKAILWKAINIRFYGRTATRRSLIKSKIKFLKNQLDTLKKYVTGDGASAVCISGGDKKEEWSVSCGDNSVQWTISKNSKGKCRVSKSADKLSCEAEDTGDETEKTCECDFSQGSAFCDFFEIVVFVSRLLRSLMEHIKIKIAYTLSYESALYVPLEFSTF